MQLSEGGVQLVYPLGLWSRSSGVVDSVMASKLFTFTLTCEHSTGPCSDIDGTAVCLDEYTLVTW